MNAKIRQAVEILKRDGVVAFPTETVYGLGARLFSEKAVKKIYALKGRPADNPLIVHIADRSQLHLLARRFPPEAKKLMEIFWPGPLTLILERASVVPKSVTAGLETVAVRMPNHPVALELIRGLGEPIAAPSANLSGRPSPTRYQDVVRELGNKVDLILDGGKTARGIESTVVDMTQIPPRLLRPGFVTLEMLKKFLPELALPLEQERKGVASLGRSAVSPGMKHPHYKPNCKVVLIHPSNWSTALSNWKEKNLRLGVIACHHKIPPHQNIVFRKSLFGSEKNYARNLYACFFDAEHARTEVLLVESLDEKGIGRAVMDRLTRASKTSA